MYTYAARLVRVIDGDTVALDLDLGFYQWRLGRSYRLARIDAPERGTEAGKDATAHVVSILTGASFLMVQTSRADSFDRWIVELFADGRNVSDEMVAAGYAIHRSY